MIHYTLRNALESESSQIKDLIHLAGINPTGLDWKRFIVAVNDDGQVMACGQIKPHGEGIREMASIATHPTFRGNGLARAVIERLLADTERPLYLMCMSKMEGLYNKFGFRKIPHEQLPRYFKRIHNIIRIATVVRKGGEDLSVMKLE
jgi:N-acetylglutamate synthase-like GNAT family acetyltransferase